MTRTSGVQDRARAATTTNLERVASFGLIVSLTLILGLVAYWTAFSTFNEWDDEGYFLLALRAFRDGGGLYERIQGVFYGPVYFQSVSGFFGLLHLPMDTAGARWLLLIGWAIACVAIARLAWRWTGSRLAAAAAVGVCFPFLVVFTNEPLHANTPIFIFLALIAFVCSGKRAPGQIRAATCGALCAAILLVKLNVGLFVLMAFAAGFAPTGRARADHVLRATLALGLVLLPFALMYRRLADPSVLDFALLASISLVPFGMLLLRSREAACAGKDRIAFLVGYAVLIAISIGGCLLDGTTLTGLWRGLVTEGWKFTALSHVNPPPLPSRALILSSSCTIPLVFVLQRRPSVLALLRLAANLVALYLSLLQWIPTATMPFMWLVVSGQRSSTTRYSLGLLTVLMCLQAFPVSGAQVGGFVVLSALVSVIGISDSCRDLLASAGTAWRPGWFFKSAAAACIVAAFATLNPLWSGLGYLRDRWKVSVLLGLPGTGPLRLTETEVLRFHWVVANLRHHGDTFLGWPGMHSFYFWSGLQPPVPFYPHHWMVYYDEEKQRELSQAVLDSARPCLLYNARLFGYWTSGPDTQGPVPRMAAESFRRLGGAGPYVLSIPIADDPDLVLTAAPLVGEAKLLAKFGAVRGLVLELPALADVRVTRVVLRDVATGIDYVDSSAGSEKRRGVVVNRRGEDLLQDPSSEGIDLSAGSEVFLLCPAFRVHTDDAVLAVLAFDARGNIVARLLIHHS